MNCAQHTEIAATAFCRECGRPMCPECQRPALGSVYCDSHAPVAPGAAAQSETPQASVHLPAPYVPPAYATPPIASPYTAAHYPPPGQPLQPDPSVHPVLALILGFIPGVGAIYNGQYVKGLVHAIVFGLLVAATTANARSEGMEAFVGIMIAAWVFYMVFEAFHTARKRRYGIAVDEFSGHLDFRGGGGRIPVGAILLIGLGFILLLDTTDIVSIEEFGKYWPLGLILLGVYMLYNRLQPDHDAPDAAKTQNNPEVGR